MKNFTLSPTVRLIQIETEYDYFTVEFTVESLNGSDFYFAIVDHQLLETQNYEFKKAKGKITGEVKCNNTTNESYFICLKADTTNVVSVDYRTRPIEQSQTPSSFDIKWVIGGLFIAAAVFVGYKIMKNNSSGASLKAVGSALAAPPQLDISTVQPVMADIVPQASGRESLLDKLRKTPVE